MSKKYAIVPFIFILSAASFVAIAQDDKYITSKFDFIPGEKVIFFDDFSSTPTGDLPARWITNGSGEVVTHSLYPGRWFHLTKEGYFMPEIRESLTENFTIEFDMVAPKSPDSDYANGIEFFILSASLDEPKNDGQPGDAGWKARPYNDEFNWSNWSLITERTREGSVSYKFNTDQKYHISISVQKQRIRFYADERKILDVADGLQAGSVHNIFRIEAYGSQPLIGEVRIAAGIPDFRSRISSDGKFIASGILFDTGSDKLRPESYSTIRLVADLLKEDASLNLIINGHTDSEGDDASNISLSKRRSDAVKEALVSKFGCDASRLQTDGKGETEPVADNSKPEGRAANRRVEFIKSGAPQTQAAEARPAGGTTAFEPVPQEFLNSITASWLIDIPRCTSDDNTEFLAKDETISFKVLGKQLTFQKSYTSPWSKEKETEEERYLLTGEVIKQVDGPYAKEMTVRWSGETKSMIVHSDVFAQNEKAAIMSDSYSLADNGQTLVVKLRLEYPKTETIRNITAVYKRIK